MNAETLKGHLDLLLLAAVQARPTHGYAIAEVLRARSDGAFDLPEGTLYPGVAPIGARRTAVEPVVRGQRSPAARLPAHAIGSPRARQAARRVARFRAGGSRSGGGSRMTSAALDAICRLERELRRRGLHERRIVEEAREHLFDAVDDGLQRGLSVDAAESDVLARFGSPEIVAGQCAAKEHRMSNWLFVILTRLAGMMRRNAPQVGHDHDVAVPSRHHFALRLKRQCRDRLKRMSADERKRFIAEKRERGEDVSAFETDPRERLDQFLREFGRRTFGAGGRSNRSPCSKTRPIPTNRAADIWWHSPAGPG